MFYSFTIPFFLVVCTKIIFLFLFRYSILISITTWMNLLFLSKPTLLTIAFFLVPIAWFHTEFVRTWVIGIIVLLIGETLLQWHHLTKRQDHKHPRLESFTLSFDIESMGLYGPGWSVGATLCDPNGNEVDSRFHFCDPAHVKDPFKRMQWLTENVIPHVTSNNTIIPDCKDAYEVRAKFWSFWRKCKDIYGDKLNVIGYANSPVETKFLFDCVLDAKQDERIFQAPFPLHELCTLMLSRGFDPHASYPRKFLNENPEHHPLADARHAARMWNDLLNDRSIL